MTERPAKRGGQFLATCFLGDLDLNGWLVLHGYALAYRQYSTRYVAEEDEATTLKRGMWAGTFEKPWDWREGERIDCDGERGGEMNITLLTPDTITVCQQIPEQ